MTNLDTIPVLLGCALVMLAVVINLLGAWWLTNHQRDQIQVAHHVSLIGSTGDGDPFVVTTYDGHAPLGVPAQAEWHNTGPLPVYVEGWAYRWQYAALSGESTVPVHLVVPPGDRIEMTCRLGITTDEPED